MRAGRAGHQVPGGVGRVVGGLGVGGEEWSAVFG